MTEVEYILIPYIRQWASTSIEEAEHFIQWINVEGAWKTNPTEAIEHWSYVDPQDRLFLAINRKLQWEIDKSPFWKQGEF